MAEAPDPMEKIEQLIEQIAEAMIADIEAAIEMILFPQTEWYADLVFSIPGVDPATLGMSGVLFFFGVVPTVITVLAGFPFYLAFHTIEERLLMEGDGDVDR